MPKASQAQALLKQLKKPLPILDTYSVAHRQFQQPYRYIIGKINSKSHTGTSRASFIKPVENVKRCQDKNVMHKHNR